MTAPTAPRNIAADLDAMLKRGSAKKAETIKKAEEVVPALDAAEVGKTVAPTTGTQAAGMKSEQSETYAAPAVGAGAENNQPNASVTNSPAGAAAAAPNGDKGAKAPNEMGTTVVKTTVNGNVMGAPEGNDTSGAFKSAAAKALAKMAAEIDALADTCIDPLHRFLAKAARASTNPEIKKVADGMDDQDLGQAAGNDLTGQVEGGQLSDEEAAQILQEAVASGAITQEELAAAVAELQGGAHGGDAAATMPPAGGAAAGDIPPAPPAPGAMDTGAPPADANAKTANAHVGPDHPNYVQKVESLYASEVATGAKFAELLADHLGFGKKADAAGANKAPESVGEKAHPGPQLAHPGKAMIEAKSDDEKKALAAVQRELGIDDTQFKALSEAPSKTLDKHASLVAEYKAVIMNKIASLA